jgi:glycosyltransferase involved in cell wall biosynthesis
LPRAKRLERRDHAPRRRGGEVSPAGTGCESKPSLLPCVVLLALPPSLSYRWYLDPVCGKSLLEWAVAELWELLGRAPWVFSRSPREAEELRRRFHGAALGGVVSDLFLISPLASVLEGPARESSQGVLVCTPLLPVAPGEIVASLLRHHAVGGSDFTRGDPADDAAPKLVSRDLLSCLAALRLEERGLVPPGNPFQALERLIGSEEFDAFFRERCGRAPKASAIGDSEPSGQNLPRAPSIWHPEDMKILRRAVSRAGGRLPVRGGELLSVWSEILARRERAKSRLAAKRLSATAPRLVKTGVPTVLHVAVESAYSGAEACFALLAANIRRDRYNPVAVVGAEGVLTEKLRAGGVPVIIPGFAYWGPSAFNISYFVELLRKHNVALVHINGWRAHSTRLAAQLLGIPVVCHLRVFPQPDFVPALAEAQVVLCVSHAVATELRRYPIAGTVVVVHDGVDLEEFPPRGSREGGGDRRVLVLANVGPGKGQELALRALPFVAQAVSNVRLLFAGDILDASYYAQLRRLVQELGCEDQVEFLGFQYPVLPLYTQADVLVVPSLREPLSHVVLEAQAVGVPAVAAANGGTPEMIQDGVNGLLFGERTPQALAEAIVRVLTDEGLAARLAQEGRRIVRSRFSIEQHADNVMAVYDAVLGRWRRRGAAAAHKYSVALTNNLNVG